jgi:hypothetical protein
MEYFQHPEAPSPSIPPSNAIIILTLVLLALERHIQNHTTHTDLYSLQCFCSGNSHMRAMNKYSVKKKLHVDFQDRNQIFSTKERKDLSKTIDHR